MDVDMLRWFQEVADGETVTGVAELAMVSQPNVSRALSRLDKEIGTPLLERHGRVLKPSAAGVVFKEYVDRALADLDDGLAAMSELQDPETGTVAISFQLSLGTWLVPLLIGEFRKIHPGVKFRLEESHDSLGSKAVLNGDTDLKFSARLPRSPDVRWEAIARERLLLAVPATHRLADQRKVSLSEVAEDDFIMLRPTWDLRARCEALCHAAGFVPKVAFECDDIPVVRGFVSQGLGIAIVPESGASATVLRDHHLLRLKDKKAERKIGLAWSAQRKLLPSAELFRQFVLSAAGKQPDDE